MYVCMFQFKRKTTIVESEFFESCSYFPPMRPRSRFAMGVALGTPLGNTAATTAAESTLF